jgi:hypothetical protein
MMTLMGIAAEAKSIPLNGLKARVVKHMESDPRRVGRVSSFILSWRERSWTTASGRSWSMLRVLARWRKSLSKELAQEVSFGYV